MKRTIKKILTVVLVGAIIAGVVALVAFLAKPKTTKEVPITAYSVGALTNEGLYLESDDSIYTKDLIGCLGLTIERDFESESEYQVFYYGEEGNFLAKTEKLDEDIYIFSADEDLTAIYDTIYSCRIVIYPDMGDVGAEEHKLYFWDVYTVANDFTVTVNKNQNHPVATVQE